MVVDFEHLRGLVLECMLQVLELHKIVNIFSGEIHFALEFSFFKGNVKISGTFRIPHEKIVKTDGDDLVSDPKNADVGDFHVHGFVLKLFPLKLPFGRYQRGF
jgi:hypothetical protein